MLDRLDGVLLRDPERGREELHGILGERIKLQPDGSGRFLWAAHSLGLTALLPNLEIMAGGQDRERWFARDTPPPEEFLNTRVATKSALNTACCCLTGPAPC